MSYKIACYTLFDITQTNVLSRHRPEVNEDVELWRQKRNTQCNFDTILQAISLRSQPDVCASPKKSMFRFDEFTEFGFLFEQEDDELYPLWYFEFEVQHPSVFNDGITELGALYSDCQDVPMLKTITVWSKLPNSLDSTDELRNIYFKVLTDA